MAVLLDVYAAGESPLPNFDSKALLQALRLRGGNGFYAESREQLETLMKDILLDDDVVLVMGAGDIGQLSKEWQAQG